MRARRLTTMRLLVVVGVLALAAFAAAPANAVEIKWTAGLDPAPNAIWLWNDINNWNATVPVDGDTLSFDDADIKPSPGNTPVGIDTKGANLLLPAANFKKTYGARKLAYFDSDFLTPNANPLASQIDFTPVGPATTIQEAASASPALTIDTLNFHTDHKEHFLIPVKAKALNVGMGQPTGDNYEGMNFWGPLSAPAGETLNVVVNNSRNWRNASLYLHNDATIDSLTLEHSAHAFFNDNTATVGALTLGGNGAVLHVNTTALTLPAAVTVPASARVQIEKTQTTWPTGMLTVEKHGSLIGDMTLAVFDPLSVNHNVDLQDGAIFAPDAGTGAPTLGQLGGTAKLYESVTTSHKTLTVGHDGTTIYKGAAFDATYGSYRASGVTVRANTGSGDLDLLYLIGAPQVGNNVRWHGDGTSTTAEVLVLNGGRLDMQYTVNQGDDYSADPTLIDTFNIMGEAGKDNANILYFREGHPHIRAEQTYNVSHGRITGTANLTGFMPGTLNMSSASLEQPSDNFAATDGSLNLYGISVVELSRRVGGDYTAAKDHTFFEALGARLTYTGTPVVRLSQRTVYGFDYDPSGANPVMAGLLKNADIAVSGYDGTEISSDLLIGHEKYFIWRWDSTANIRSEHYGVESTVGDLAKLKPAMNAPPGVKNVLGIAPNDTFQNAGNKINVEVDATGAILRVGSDDPNRIPSFYNGELKPTPHDGTVEFRQAVLADKLEIRSGTARFYTDITIPWIDIGAGTTLRMNGNATTGTTATVTEKLSGTGMWTGGKGVVLPPGAHLAPGHSVGALNQGGGLLEFSDSIVYEWELADATGGPGVGWDIVWGDPLQFIGDPTVGITIEILDAGLVGLLDGSDYFAIAAGSFDIPDDLVVLFDTSVAGWDVSGCQLEYDSTDVDGDGVVEPVLFLTGLVVTDEPGPGPDVIPEPATLSLLGLGALALLRRRRRR